MNLRLAHRVKQGRFHGDMVDMLINKIGYLALAFIALWASVMCSDYCEQFLTLAIILGLRWICGSGTQVIQIVIHDEQ